MRTVSSDRTVAAAFGKEGPSWLMSCVTEARVNGSVSADLRVCVSTREDQTR